MVESSGTSSRVEKVNGMVLVPAKSIDALILQQEPLQWQLSEDDLDVNYIAHIVKEPDAAS